MSSKVTGRIITVDPSNRIVEAGIRDGAIKISVKEAGPIFRWPRQNELWTFYREGTGWKLGDKLEENGMETKPITDLESGETKISSDVIYTETSRLLTIEVQDPIALPLATGWSNFALGWADAAYYKDRDRVYLEGSVKYSSGGNSTIGTLPVGYHPSADITFPVTVFGAIENVTINSAGIITSQFVDGASKVFTSLDGVSFRV
jgi:hypothetical protein